MILRDAMVYGLLETYRRHKLKFLIYELHGEEDVPLVLDSGATLISDFVDWHRQRNQAPPDFRRRPCLFAIDREVAGQHRATWMSSLFFSRQAWLGLSPAEQKNAARALTCETGSQLAHHPEISPNSVRRHLRSTFEKFEAVRIQLMPADLGHKRRRGSISVEAILKKKRPFLLNYLRRHPEQLLPQAAAITYK